MPLSGCLDLRNSNVMLNVSVTIFQKSSRLFSIYYLDDPYFHNSVHISNKNIILSLRHFYGGFIVTHLQINAGVSIFSYWL